MTMTPLSVTRPLLLAVALFAAASAHAQLKASPSSAGGTGLKAAPSRAPAPAPAPEASSPAAAAPAASSAATVDPEQAQKETLAASAAAGWLTLLDRRDWGTAWETTASLFRRNVPLDRWMDGVPKVRADLGDFSGERAQVATTYKRELPGQPKGEYVTVQFLSRFAQRDVEEVVTTVREPNGAWRVTGYSTR